MEGRELKLTNLDKVLYPEAGFTKGEVVDYYARVAPAIIPHLAGRALTLRRFPEGVEDTGAAFFEKRCPKHRPDWVRTIAAPAGPRAGRIEHCACEDLPTLVWLAQLAAIELHPFLALGTEPSRPTVMAFDLDPGPPAEVLACARVALRLREVLDHLGVECFAKTSGSKGLQVYVPLNMGTSYEETRPVARAIARLLAKEDPRRILAKMGKKTDRRGKVLVDWYQNHERKTTVAAYSLRARERPTVSTPVAWEELQSAAESGDAASLAFEAGDVIDRLDRDGDPFAPVLELKQNLPNP